MNRDSGAGPASGAAPGGSGGFSLVAAGRTDRGRVRRRNEDALLVRPDAGLLAVADGMGGGPGGDVASRLALESLEEALGAEIAPEEMARALEAARARVVEAADRDHGLRGLGTTVTALRIDLEDGAYVVGHVGDSRAYLLDASGFRRLSRDHTWVQEEVDEGRLSLEEAERHPMGHLLTQVLGDLGGISPQLLSGSLEEGSRILLCTDGLTAGLSEREIGERLAAEEDVEALADDLVERTLSRGAPDNVTVVAADLRRSS